MTVCLHENIIRRLYIPKNQHSDGRLEAVIYSDVVRIKQLLYLFINVLNKNMSMRAAVFKQI